MSLMKQKTLFLPQNLDPGEHLECSVRKARGVSASQAQPAVGTRDRQTRAGCFLE